MANLGGLATALGLGFQGYGQDVTTNLARQRQTMLDAQNTQKFGLDQRLGQAQIGNYEAETAKRKADAALAVAKGNANQRAYGALRATTPTHPLSQTDFDPDTDYTGALHDVQTKGEDAKKATAINMSYYNALKTEFPTHPLAQAPFDPANPMDFKAAYGDAQKLRQSEAAAGKTRNIDPLSPEGIAARVSTAKQIAASKPKVETPDQIKSNTVLSLADPAANTLLQYHGGSESGMRRGIAALASHVPFIGNSIEGSVDEPYQNAMNAARVLGTQYLEIMPKSRFQPSTIDDIMKQIAPSLGDSPSLKAQKIQRVKDLQAAIRKRAKNPTDLQGPSLDDVPLPPGIP